MSIKLRLLLQKIIEYKTLLSLYCESILSVIQLNKSIFNIIYFLSESNRE